MKIEHEEYISKAKFEDVDEQAGHADRGNDITQVTPRELLGKSQITRKKRQLLDNLEY